MKPDEKHIPIDELFRCLHEAAISDAISAGIWPAMEFLLDNSLPVVSEAMGEAVHAD